MSKINMCYVIADGNLVADPELRTINTGSKVCNFTIAVNGLKEGEVSFFDVETWGKIAENCSEYLVKGNGVTVRGDLKQIRWDNPEGKKMSKVIIKADHVRFESRPREKEQAEE